MHKLSYCLLSLCMQRRVIFSQAEDPTLNLAFEHYLFQQIDSEQECLLLYRNKPSIIIGRAQNPWAECRVSMLERDGVPVVRRQSGGGTVYHDLGNLCYTFMTPKHGYDKDKNYQLIINVLSEFGIKARRNHRTDLVLDHNGGELKFSGNAFRETKDRAFHHGTLLINAELDQLKKYLHYNETNLDRKGVASVGSEVVNLSELSPHLNYKNLSETLAKYYLPGIPIEYIDAEQILTIPTVQIEQQKLQSWDWTFAKTLPFIQIANIQLDGKPVDITLEVITGRIASITGNNIEALQATIIGQPYQNTAIMQSLKSGCLSELVKQLKNLIP